MSPGRFYLLPVLYILFCQAVFIAVGHMAVNYATKLSRAGPGTATFYRHSCLFNPLKPSG
jgi:hypothetical protein